MTWGGRLASVFPVFHILLILALSAVTILQRSLWAFAGLIFVIYLLPLCLFRIHNLFFPLKEEIIDITARKYNVWWTTHQLQMLYIAVPSIEGVLHMVPGLYSLWLRLWGSRIGRKVYWTPKTEIVDRGLLEVGDGVVVGHLCAFCSHAISPINGKMSLIVQNVRVGERAFLATQVQLGPGAVIEPHKLVKPKTTLYWKGEYR